MVATFSPAQSLSNGMASDSRVMMRHISGTAENSAKATETKVWGSAIAASTATVPVHNAIRKPAMENMMALAAKGRRRIRLTCLGARTWAAPKPRTRKTSHPQMPRKANLLSANPNTTSCASSESHSAPSRIPLQPSTFLCPTCDEKRAEALLGIPGLYTTSLVRRNGAAMLRRRGAARKGEGR